MNKRIENNLSMFKTVQTVCDINLALITPNVGLNNTYTQFNTLMNSVTPIAQVQTTNKKGIAIDKKRARQNLVLAIEVATGIIKAHFDSVQNAEIFLSVNVSFSRLQNMRDSLFVIYAENVIALLNTHQLTLAPFGVDAAFITNITTLLGDYIQIISMPTAARNSISTATAELKMKRTEIANFLNNELDNAMLVLKQSEPTFYFTYRNARKIIDSGIRHKDNTLGKIEGVIKDEVTNQVIADALIEIINTDTLVISNELGAFTIINIPAGTYDIKVSVGNYDNKTIENIVVTAAQTTALDIKLTSMV